MLCDSRDVTQSTFSLSLFPCLISRRGSLLGRGNRLTGTVPKADCRRYRDCCPERKPDLRDVQEAESRGHRPRWVEVPDDYSIPVRRLK